MSALPERVVDDPRAAVRRLRPTPMLAALALVAALGLGACNETDDDEEDSGGLAPTLIQPGDGGADLATLDLRPTHG